MSFKCGLCRKTSQPREKAVRVITGVREIVYSYRPKAHSNGKDDPGGKGTAIVAEVLAHRKCAEARQ